MHESRLTVVLFMRMKTRSMNAFGEGTHANDTSTVLVTVACDLVAGLILHFCGTRMQFTSLQYVASSCTHTALRDTIREDTHKGVRLYASGVQFSWKEAGSDPVTGREECANRCLAEEPRFSLRGAEWYIGGT